MHAAVYRGLSVVNVEEIPTPAIQPGEILDSRGSLRYLPYGPQED
jgi:hypothetical protein